MRSEGHFGYLQMLYDVLLLCNWAFLALRPEAKTNAGSSKAAYTEMKVNCPFNVRKSGNGPDKQRYDMRYRYSKWKLHFR